MAISLHDFQINNAGLGTYTHTCASTALYDVDVFMQIQPGSSLVIVIKQNSTTLATSATPTSTQSHMELQARQINCTANDTLEIDITSAATADALPQATQGIIKIGKVGQT